MMKRIRGGMGIGDALYVQAVARYLVNRGETLEVCTAWPDVFRPIRDKVLFAPFSRHNIQYLAHYSLRKGRPETTQFEDCCIQGGMQHSIPLCSPAGAGAREQAFVGQQAPRRKRIRKARLPCRGRRGGAPQHHAEDPA